MNSNSVIIGPFSQILTMDLLPADGPIPDSALHILKNACVRVENGQIVAVGPYEELHHFKCKVIRREGNEVLMPGLIDAHTHLCYAGTRVDDYAQRLQGKTYPQIAAAGGGILSTVEKTRKSSKEELKALLEDRVNRQKSLGVTTCEVKSGYGLNIEDEIKQLEVINEVRKGSVIDLVPTCLAAHALPIEFSSSQKYLSYLAQELLPVLSKQDLTHRVDIYVDEGAFSVEEARGYLEEAKRQGFHICVHADQFVRGGAQLAAELHAVSADHLEASTEEDFKALKKSEVIPVLLPGACLGMGMAFPKARKMLDAGLPVVIASDWNPGTAPMGNLLAQAAMMGVAERLTVAETLAALTIRAARALNFVDRGRIAPGFRPDMIAFPCKDYREILYYQGMMHPSAVFTHWKFAHGLDEKI